MMMFRCDMENVMTFSFLGLSKPVTKVYEALSGAVKDYRTMNMGAPSTLTPGGVYVPDLEKCTEFASSRGMAVYMNVGDLIKKSDIIFVFLHDSTFKNLHKTLRRLEIKDKIFCHFNPDYDAEIMDFGPDNTYVSILVPAMHKNGLFDLSYGLIMQGYGSRYDEFVHATQTLGIKVKSLNADEKCLYQAAVNILKYLPNIAVESSKRLAKAVLGADNNITELFNSVKVVNEYNMPSYSPCDDGNVDYIDNQKKLLKSMGLEDVEVLYAALLLAKAIRGDMELFQSIKDVAKTIIRKL